MENAIILIVGGLAMILIALSTVSAKSRRLFKIGETVEGIISEIAEATGDEVTEYFPVIKFYTRNRKLVEKVATDVIISGVLEAGTKVTVIYDPQNPEEFAVKSVRSIWIARILIAIGATAILSGTYLLLNSEGYL